MPRSQRSNTPGGLKLPLPRYLTPRGLRGVGLLNDWRERVDVEVAVIAADERGFVCLFVGRSHG